MPPFRYLGNILAARACVFCLGVRRISAWARAWESGDCARAFALTEAGLVSEDGGVARFLEAARFARFDIDRFAPL